MFRSIKDLIGHPVVAQDGRAGRVVDVMFGDRHWRLRCLDVETRPRFHINLRYLSTDEREMDSAGRHLVPADRVEPLRMGSARGAVYVKASSAEIRAWPRPGECQPVEEQYDREFAAFYRHAVYDDRPNVWASSGEYPYAPPDTAYDHTEEELEEHRRRMEEIAREHMHSALAVLGYDVRGVDGATLGTLCDLILDAESGTLSSLAVDTRRGFPSRKHLLPMGEVAGLNWSQSIVECRLSADELGQAPRFHPRDAVNAESSEGRSYDYCGKPCLKFRSR